MSLKVISHSLLSMGLVQLVTNYLPTECGPHTIRSLLSSLRFLLIYSFFFGPIRILWTQMISLLCVLLLDCQSALGMQDVLHVIPLSVFLAHSCVRLDTASVRKSLGVFFPQSRVESFLWDHSENVPQIRWNHREGREDRVASVAYCKCPYAVWHLSD